MEKIQPRYRLRNGEKVVGYMRKVADSMIMYSADSFWWTGNQISYADVDEWTGFKDKNDHYIYEWDILYYKLDPDGEYLTGVVLWEANAEEFGIRNVVDGAFIPLSVNDVQMFQKKQMQVFSYLFLNPELQRKLGVSDH